MPRLRTKEMQCWHIVYYYAHKYGYKSDAHKYAIRRYGEMSTHTREGSWAPVYRVKRPPPWPRD